MLQVKLPPRLRFYDCRASFMVYDTLATMLFSVLAASLDEAIENANSVIERLGVGCVTVEVSNCQ